MLLMVQYQDVYTENLYLKTSLMNLTYAVLCITSHIASVIFNTASKIPFVTSLPSWSTT